MNQENKADATLDRAHETESCSKVADPAVSATPFSPDLLAVAGIVARARQYAPTPPAMVVMPDGSEGRL